MSDSIIGRRLVVDGVERDVYRARDGRHYVVGYDGEPGYGVWIQTDEVEADAPWIVSVSG